MPRRVRLGWLVVDAVALVDAALIAWALADQTWRFVQRVGRAQDT